MKKRPIRTIWVCQCCLLSREHGEPCCALDGHQGNEPWALIPLAESVTFGMLEDDHMKKCLGNCNCAVQHFSRQSCDGCGTRSHGGRYAYVYWG